MSIREAVMADASSVARLLVDEAARGRGVGRALVEAIEAEARARGCVLLFLTSNERRGEAHAFYRALGFEETGRRFAKSLDSPQQSRPGVSGG